MTGWSTRFLVAQNRGGRRHSARGDHLLEVFKARPDVNAVMHCHAPMCVALSMANKQIETLHIQSKQFVGGVPIFPKPIYILDAEEGKDLARVTGNSVAVLIKGHGIVTAGATIREACFHALYLERTAKMQAVEKHGNLQAETRRPTTQGCVVANSSRRTSV